MFAILPVSSEPSRVPHPELPRGHRRHGGQGVVAGEAARDRLAHAPSEVLGIVESGGREREGQPRVLHPLRIRRRAVDVLQAFKRNIQPLGLLVQPVGPREVHAQDEIGPRSHDLLSQSVFVPDSHGDRLQFHLPRDLSGAKERQDVGRLEEHGLSAFRGGKQRGVGLDHGRSRLPDGALRVGRPGVFPPERVAQGLPHEGHGAHPRGRVGGSGEGGEVEPLRLERHAVRGLGVQDAVRRRLFPETDDGTPAPQDSGLRDGVNDRETEAAVGLRDLVADHERVHRPLLGAHGRQGMVSRRGWAPGRRGFPFPLLRLLLVGRPLRLLAREPVGKNVGVHERGVDDLAREVEDAGIGGDGGPPGRAHGLDDAAAHDDGARIEDPPRRRDDLCARQRESQAVAASNLADARAGREQQSRGERERKESGNPKRGPHAASGILYAWPPNSREPF